MLIGWNSFCAEPNIPHFRERKIDSGSAKKNFGETLFLETLPKKVYTYDIFSE